MTLARLLLLALCSVTHPLLFAQTRTDPVNLAPVVSPEELLGADFEQRIFSHREVAAYFKKLSADHPDQMRLISYGTSWQGRELYYVIIGSAEQLKGLEVLQEKILALSLAELTEAEAEVEMADLPATVWLAYGIHGDEISSSNAAMKTAHELLTKGVPSDVLVFIDPMQNPDGRDRFVSHFRNNLGLSPRSSPYAAEHIQTWPGGRTNHYLFDLNRDFFALTQPETRGRVAALQQWFPLVYVDLHEMGGNSSYFFPPVTLPTNPYLSNSQVELLSVFGRESARAFDRRGIDYFTREVFDWFYPGYGDSWPGLYGAVGMTYEQASARGMIFRRRDGSVLTFGDGVQNHFLTSMATITTAQGARDRLWRSYYGFRRAGVSEAGRHEHYILPLSGNLGSVHKLAGLLLEQGVTLQQADSEISSCGTHPSGSYIIPMSQPSRNRVKALLDPQVDMQADFIQEQERRREVRLGHEMYDVTAWSLPFLFNVKAVSCDRRIKGDLQPVSVINYQTGSVPSEAEVAYLVPWNSNSAGKLLSMILQQGIEPLTTPEAFRLDGRDFPAGTLIFKTRDAMPGLSEMLKQAAMSTGAELVATDSSWVESGLNFGSNKVKRLRPVEIALAWESPSSPGDAGATRFVLEQQYHYPVTPVSFNTLGYADLSEFDVIILPHGYYSSDQRLNNRLKSFVKDGGTLVAFGGAAAGLSEDLLGTRREYSYQNPDDKPKTGKPEKDDARLRGTLITDANDYDQHISAEKQPPDRVPGVILKAKVDQEHWLTVGTPESVYIMYSGQDIFRPITLDKGRNLVRYVDQENLLSSGYLWKENQAQLAFKPFLMHRPLGDGQVITFTSSPTVRAYLDGLNLLLLNAVFRGPAWVR